MHILKTGDKNFTKIFKRIVHRGEASSQDVEDVVREILYEVRVDGDAALIRLTEKFDRVKLTHRQLALPKKLIKESHRRISQKIRAALIRSYERIEKFHRRQMQNSWIQPEPGGAIVGQMVRPLERVGIYVPGGKAVYPSSVLMNALPALVAGVREIIMVTPCSHNGINPVLLVAADLCGIEKVFQIGGAQAVAALAYGTESVPRVDKIVGPGNIFVATAKRLVYGDVDNDMIAGPSEILIIADGSCSPAFAAADMLSQAEHDEMACSLLLTTDERFARSVAQELVLQLKKLKRREIAYRSLESHGAIIVTKTIQEAIQLANDVSPEHLELLVEKPWDILPEIKNAGAVFMGHYSPEALGDYLAGPNHVLPTGGTARFFSPLSVDTFLKKTSIISFTDEKLQTVGADIMALAETELLDAHARSVEKRLHKARR
jgi:histidinol dehydrogenase